MPPVMVLDNPFELVADRQGALRPGDRVACAFRFAVPGDATARDLRVRFSPAPGLTPADVARLDGTELGPVDRDEDGALRLPPLEGGSEHVVAAVFVLADAVRDGAPLEIRAVLIDATGGEMPSNRVVLSARGEERLRNERTAVMLEAVEAEPDTLRMVANVHNAGNAGAEDVELTLPLPAGLAFDNLRSIEAGAGEIVALEERLLRVRFAALAARETRTVAARVRVVAPFPGEAVVLDDARVGSRATVPFALGRAAVKAGMRVDLDGSDAAVEPRDTRPGDIVEQRFTARNDGRSPARDLRVRMTLPEGLAYLPGTRALDGAPLAEETRDDGAVEFVLDRLDPSRSATFTVRAAVLAPAEDGTRLTAAMTLSHAGGTLERRTELRVGAFARFTRERAWVEALDEPRVDAGATVRFEIAALNEGTAVARRVRLRFDASGFASLALADESAGTLRTAYDARARAVAYLLDIGDLAPHQRMRVVVAARVPETVGDRTECSLAASLRADGVPELALGSGSVIARSAGALRAESSKLRVVASAPLRLMQTAELRVHLRNEGTDLLRDVRCVLNLPPGLTIERVVGARRDDEALVLADLPPGAPAEASILVRLVEPQAGDAVLAVGAVVTSEGRDPLALSATVATFGEPALADPIFEVRSASSGGAHPGDDVECEAVLENLGDAIPARVVLRLRPDAALRVVAHSTRVDGSPAADRAATPRILDERGLVLGGLTPGEPVRIRWRARIDDALDAPRTLTPEIEVRVDDGAPLTARAALRVEPRGAATPAASSYTAAAAEPDPAPAADVADDDCGIDAPVAAAPAEAPVSHNGDTDWLTGLPVARGAASAPPEAPYAAPAPPFTAEPHADPVITSLSLDEDRAARLVEQLRVLATSGDLGLYRHALAARLFFPDAFDAHEPATLDAVRERMRRGTGAALLRVQVPGFNATEAWLTSLEDAALRSAILDLTAMLAGAGGAGLPPERHDAITGALDIDELAHVRTLLADAPLGSPASAYAFAAFAGTRVGANDEASEALRAYRSELLDVLASAPDTVALLEPAPSSLDDALTRLVDALGTVAAAPAR